MPFLTPAQVSHRFGFRVDLTTRSGPHPTCRPFKERSGPWIRNRHLGTAPEWCGPMGRRTMRAVDCWLSGFGGSVEEEPATPYFAPSCTRGRNGRFKRKYLRQYLLGCSDWLATWRDKEAPVCAICFGYGCPTCEGSGAA